jgi:uncharacterized membrane protein YfcA
MTSELGFALACAAGFSLGLVGGGGALLTVPILVYGFHHSMALGTGYSLFVVGIASLLGAFMAFRRGRVDLPAAWTFVLPSFVGVYLSRSLLLHRLPETLGSLGGIRLSRDGVLMAAFGLVMVGAAFLTLRTAERKPSANAPGLAKPAIAAVALLVGVLTGLFGAGGGFLIVPALVLGARLPMERAVGTSLVIVAVNAWFGILGDLGRMDAWNWPFLLLFTAFSLAGVLLGQALNGRLSGPALKHAFAWFTFTLGLFIFLRELAQGVPWS